MQHIKPDVDSSRGGVVKHRSHRNFLFSKRIHSPEEKINYIMSAVARAIENVTSLSSLAL